MAVLNLLATTVDPPKGLWEWLLGVFSFISDYGWRIIVFTVLLKLLLSPLDFYQRYKMKKNQRISKLIEPEMERLKRQFPDDRAKLQTAQYQLQKANGFSTFSACIPMIVTLVVFFTLWTGMRNISQYEEFKRYLELYDRYNARYVQLTNVNIDGNIFIEDTNEFDSKEIDKLLTGWASNNTAEAAVLFKNEYGGDYNKFIEDYLSKKPVRDFYVQEKPFTIVADDASKYDTDIFITASSTFDLEKINNLYKSEPSNPTLIAAISELRQKINGKTFTNAPSDFPASFSGFSEIYTAFDKSRSDIDGFERAERAFNEYKAVARDDAGSVAHEFYKENNSKFFWIKSIWVADVYWEQSIRSFESFKNGVSAYLGAGSALPDELRETLNKKDVYDSVMQKIKEDPELSGGNGFFVLIVLAVGLSFLSQFLTTRQQQKSGQVAAGGRSMKMMMFIMPFIIGFFAFGYSSAFALYMVTNSAMGLILNLLTTMIINAKMGSGQSKESVTETGVVKYGRRDPNDFNKK